MHALASRSASALVALLTLAPTACEGGAALTDDRPAPDTTDATAGDTALGEDTRGDDASDDADADDADVEVAVSRCPPDRCELDERCVENLAPNPDNPCEVCLVAISAVAWTANDGAGCGEATACAAPRCRDGACVIVPLACDDGQPCTEDACLEPTGCVHTPRTGPCEDGEPCTVGDACDGGVCRPGGPAACDDGSPCTADRCVPGVGCVGDPVAGPCDDGDACTHDDRCDGGVCRPGLPRFCDDFDACTADYCEGDVCHHVDLAQLCPDDNPCTVDGCDRKLGCVYTFVTDACDDHNACTGDDACAGGACRGAPVAVDDGDPCTVDACDPVGGVTHVLEPTLPCDDGDVCTLGDHCAAGGCAPGAQPLACDDLNPCTSDGCDPVAGCVNTPNALACDDGDACTAGDTCDGGRCLGVTVSCDDHDACTDDFCDPAQGCVSTPVISQACRPTIVVTAPARAARITDESGEVLVTGRITSGAGDIVSATLNGEPLELNGDGTFVHFLLGVRSGLHTLVFTATDDHGQGARRVQSFVIADEYLMPVVANRIAYPASSAIEVFLGQDAVDDGDRTPPLQDLGSIVEQVFRGLDPATLTPEPFTLSADYTAYVKHLRYDLVGATLAPTGLGIRVTARLEDLSMDVGVVGTCTFCPSATGVATSASMDVEALLTLGAEQVEPDPGEPVDPQDLRLVATASAVHVDLAPLDVTFDDPIEDVLLGELATGLANLLRAAVEGLLGDSLGGTLEGLMTQAVRAFRPSFDVNVGPIVLGGPELNVVFRTRPQAPSHVTGGAILAFRVGATGLVYGTPVEFDGVPKLTTCDGVTALPEALPLPRSHDVELLIEDDAANQIVYGLWREGLLDFTLPESMLAGADLADFGVSDLAIALVGLLPPTMDGCDGRLRMRLGDLRFRVTLRVLGQPKTLDVYVATTADVVMTPVDGALRIALTDVDEVFTEVDVHGDPVLLGMIEPIAGAVEGVLVPSLVSLLAERPLAEYPLPGFDLAGLSDALPARTELRVVVDEVLRAGATLVGAHLEAPPLCEDDAVCPDATFCKGGACVGCLEPGDCPDLVPEGGGAAVARYCYVTDDFGLTRCRARKETGLAHDCDADLECLSGHCGADNTCVECTTHAHCRDVDAGYCEDEACRPSFPDDAACTFDEQCDSQRCGTGVFERFCYTPASRDPGEACHVQGQCTSSQCLVGGTCGCNGLHATCGEGRWCDVGSACQDELPNGHLCGGDVECESHVCDTTCVDCTAVPPAGCDLAGEYCEATTCHPKGSEGDDCAFDDQCFSGTCALGVCESACSDSLDCDPGEWCSLVLGACQDARPSGDGCTDAEQCSSGICAFPGTCVDCLDDGDCTGEDHCDDTVGGPFACRPPAAVGAHCEAPGWCASGVCDGFTCVACTAVPPAGCDFAGAYCEGAQCKAKKADGGSCDFGDQCVSGRCAYGSCRQPCSGSQPCAGTATWCDTLAAACIPKYPTGAGCFDGDQCVSGICNVGTCVACNDDSRCAASQHCDNRVGGSFSCKADVPNGQHCEGPGWCTSGVCDGGTCVQCTALPAAGCDFADQYCEGAQCKAKKDDGVSCGFDDQCVSGLCAGLVCRAPCTATSQCGTGAWCDTAFGACIPARPNGSFCTEPEQCTSGICNVGTCVACNADSQCGASQHCDNRVGASFTCEADVANGQHCERPSWCTSGVCDGGTCVQCTAIPAAGCDFQTQNCVATKCVNKTPLGGSCGVNADCQSDACNLFQCVACNRNAQCPPSQHCDTALGGDYRCESDYNDNVGGCVDDAWCVHGHCVLGTCRRCTNATVVADCGAGKWCNANNCANKKANGALCGTGVECLSGCCNFPYVCGPCN